MTPSARIACGIEILEDFSNQPLAWARFFPIFFRQRRYAGAKDRRYVFELAMGIFRHYFSLKRAMDAIGLPISWRNFVIIYLLIIKELDLADIQRLFTGKYITQPLQDEDIKALSLYSGFNDLDLGLELPDMLFHSLEQTYKAQLPALMGYLCESKAAFDLRINPQKIDREDAFERLSADHFPTTHLPDFPPFGMRLWNNANIQNHPLYKNGSIEIQDFGSQTICAIMAEHIRNPSILWDFCAGAGGKSLNLASQNPKLKVILSDITKSKLKEAQKRFDRAGLKPPKILLLTDDMDISQAPNADAIIVDVPCSGMGTWRRNPDLKIRLSLERLAEICTLQAQILEQASLFTKKHGLLIYITCSLLYEENEAQIKKFLEKHQEFAIKKIHISPNYGQKTKEGYVKILPNLHHSDGFFMAILEKH